MSRYRVFETVQFQKDLEKLARSGWPRIAEKLRRIVYPELRNRPQIGAHIKKLRAYEPETWRYRIGPWRFFYEIDDEEKIVFMTAASHRGSSY